MNSAFACVTLLIVCLVAFANTLQADFYCDDFTLLQFLHTFYRDGWKFFWVIFATPAFELQPFLQCYRPIPDVVFLVTYLLAGTNAYWYHFANIINHWLASVCVFFIGVQLASPYAPDSKLVAFIAAAGFAAYPLTAEVVWGPINIVTGLCVMFFLATVALFLAWQNGKDNAFLYSSVACFILSILSKEMAVVLPAVLFVSYWLFNATNNIISRSQQSWRATMPFWLGLMAFLIVRAIVLGPQLGGYRGPLGDESNLSMVTRIFSDWPLICAFPINNQVFSANGFIIPALIALYAILLILAGRRLMVAKTPGQYPLLLLLSFWIAACFLPVIPVWNLEPSLAGGRHMYAISAPLFLLLAIFTYQKTQRLPWCITWTTLIVLYIALNIKNSVACIEASHEAISMKRATVTALDALPQNQSIVLLGAPFKTKGIYVFATSDMLRSMFAPPCTVPNLNNRIALLAPWVNVNYQFFSLERLQRLCQSPEHKVLVWHGKDKVFKPLNIDFGTGDLEQHIVSSRRRFDQTNNLCIEEFTCAPQMLQQTAFVECTLSCKRLSGVPAGTRPAISLWWRTGDGQQEAEAPPIYLPVIDDGQPHRYIFPVSASTDWLFADHSGHLEIRVPSPNFQNTLEEVTLLGRNKFVPTIDIVGLPGQVKSPRAADDGINELAGNTCTIKYDRRTVKNAAKIVIEISQPETRLEKGIAQRNRCYTSPRAAHRIIRERAAGTITLDGTHFKTPGLYEIEAGTINQDGTIGNFSDPLFVRVPQSREKQ